MIPLIAPDKGAIIWLKCTHTTAAAAAAAVDAQGNNANLLRADRQSGCVCVCIVIAANRNLITFVSCVVGRHFTVATAATHRTTLLCESKWSWRELRAALLGQWASTMEDCVTDWLTGWLFRSNLSVTQSPFGNCETVSEIRLMLLLRSKQTNAPQWVVKCTHKLTHQKQWPDAGRSIRLSYTDNRGGKRRRRKGSATHTHTHTHTHSLTHSYVNYLCSSSTMLGVWSDIRIKVVCFGKMLWRLPCS